MAEPEHRPADLGFLFIGGMHQALHIAPLALALARRAGVVVSAYINAAESEALGALLDRLDADAATRIAVVPLVLPRWLRAAVRLAGGRGEKPLLLLAARRMLLRHDALVATERTSTVLKRLPGRRPVMIHYPHGAGDRSRGFDPRIRLFDHVLVAGPMVYARTLAQGLAGAGNCTIAGSIKLSVLTGPASPRPEHPFADGRPVILYNPHFDTRLSSWPMARGLIDRIVGDGRFNLIVAPHARLFEAMGEEERAVWLGREMSRSMILDAGSPRLSDMSYTRLADIYLGDVSSQVYEFLHKPRPCIFIDAHGVRWRDNPDYAMWTLGDVCSGEEEVLEALGRVRGRHSVYRPLQVGRVAEVLGPTDPGVPDRAADQVLDALERLGPGRPSPPLGDGEGPIYSGRP